MDSAAATIASEGPIFLPRAGADVAASVTTVLYGVMGVRRCKVQVRIAITIFVDFLAGHYATTNGWSHRRVFAWNRIVRGGVIAPAASINPPKT